MTFAPDASAPAQARRASRQVLVGWRLPGLVDSVLMVVSELVTNAVRHGRPPVWLELRRSPAALRVSVHDDDPTDPGTPSPSGEDDESGRGLAIVRALAVEVGVEQVPGDGKVMFASFGLAGDGTAPCASQDTV